MAQIVDERIVAAKFDAEDFEKGVDKTVKKLDELKKALEFTESTKAAKEHAEKIEDSTNSIGNSLDKLTERLTTFKGMIKQKILSGLAEEFSQVFLKIEQTVKNFITGISTQQVGVGLQKYEQILKSVRVMMASGESQESSYEAIDRLGRYADQTSYSLVQMTDALSKMRAAGVDIDTATKSVEGIANACANAGINATDAQRAFFNLSQAYSMGKLTGQDYKSLELLNMTTREFKQSMLDAAVAAGTLKKVKEGIYVTQKSKTNKNVTAGKKVNIDNVREMLKYGFMDKEAMNQLFGGKFFLDEDVMDAIFEENGLDKSKREDRDKAYKIAAERFGDIAVNAYKAARECRSFTDVMNTIKDVVSTGWATTFELIFGKLEEATEFFTDLTEGPLANAIYRIGEWRNEVLGNVHDAEGSMVAGKMFRQTIMNITDALGTLINTFEDVAPDSQSFGNTISVLAIKIKAFSIKVKDAAENFRNWMQERAVKDGPTRIERIRNILANISGVITIFGKAFSTVFNVVGKVLTTLSPVFDGTIAFFEKLTEPISQLGKNTQIFTTIEDSADNFLKVINPIAEGLGKITAFLGDVGAFIINFAIDGFVANLSFIADIIQFLTECFTGSSAQKLRNGTGFIDQLYAGLNNIKQICTDGLGAIKEFFGALISDLRRLFGLTTEMDENSEEGGVFSGITKFFQTNQFIQDAKTWINQAIIDVGNFIKSIPQRIKKFGENIYNTIWGLFFEEKTAYNGSQLETKTVKTPLGEWLDKVIKDVKDFIVSIPQRIIEGVGKVGNWINSIFNYFLGDKNEDDISKTPDSGKKVTSKFDEFVQNAKQAVIDWFNDLPNKIRQAFKSIGDFASRLIKAVDEFLFGKKVLRAERLESKDGKRSKDLVEKRYKTGFSKWLDGAIKSIRKFINNIPEYIKKGIKGAGDLISMVVNALLGRKEGETGDGSKTVESKLLAPFKNINLQNILNTIKDIGLSIFNQLARIFTGSDDLDYNKEWFADSVAEGIKWIKEKAVTAFEAVKNWFINLPTTIANFFKGKDSDEEKSNIQKAIEDFGKAIGGFIQDLPTTIAIFFNNAINALGDLWNLLYEALTGGSHLKEDIKTNIKDGLSETGGTINELLSQFNSDVDSGLEVGEKKSKWEQFVESIGSLISNAFAKLPVWIANGLEIAVNGIGDAITWITDKISNVDWANFNLGDLFGKSKDGIEKGAEEVGESTEEEGESAFKKAIIKLGLAIKKLFTDIIPKFISSAWTAISDIGSGAWTAIKDIFSETPKTEFGKAVRKFAQDAYDAIVRDVPKFISDAFNWVKEQISKLFGKKTNSDLKTISIKERIDMIKGKTKKEIKKESKESEVSDGWGFGDLIESIKSVLATITPTIVDALAKAFNIFSKLGKIIAKVFQGTPIGDAVEDEFGTESDSLKKSLNEFGQAFVSFFTDTLPELIGSGIGALVKNVPKWFDKIFSSFTAAAKADADEAEEELTPDNKAGEAAKGALETITSTLETLSKNAASGKLSSLASLAIVIVGLIALFKTIREFFSLFNKSGNEAREAEAKNSIESIIKAVIYAIITLMAFTAYVSTLDDAQYAKAEKTLDKVMEIIKWVTTIYGIIKGGEQALEGIKLFKGEGDGAEDAASDLADSAKGIKSKIADFGDGIMSSVKIVGGAAAGGMAGELITGAFGDILDNLSSDIASISSAISLAIDNVEEIVQKLIKMKDDIDIAIEVAGKIKDLFVDVDGSVRALPLEHAEAFSSDLTALSGGIAMIVTATTIDADEKSVIKDITDFIASFMDLKQKIIEFVELGNDGNNTFEDFKYMIATLSSALSLLSTSTLVPKNFSNDDVDLLVEVGTKLFENEKFIALFTNFDKLKVPSGVESYKKAESAIIFAGFIKSLSEASKGLSAENGEAINGFFSALDKIDFWTAKDDTSMDDESLDATVVFSDKMAMLGVAIGSFADNTKNINREAIDTSMYAIDILIEFGRRIKSLGKGWIDEVLTGKSDLTEFAKGVKNLGGGIRDFLFAIEGFDKDTGKYIHGDGPMEHNLELIKTVGTLLRDISQIGDGVLNGYVMLDANDIIPPVFSDFLKALCENLEGIGIAVTGFLDSIISFYNEHKGTDKDPLSPTNKSIISDVLNIVNNIGQFYYSMAALSIAGGKEGIKKALKDFHEAFGGWTDSGFIKETTVPEAFTFIYNFVMGFYNTWNKIKSTFGLNGIDAERAINDVKWFSNMLGEILTAFTVFYTGGGMVSKFTKVKIHASGGDLANGYVVAENMLISIEDSIILVNKLIENMDNFEKLLTSTRKINIDDAIRAREIFEAIGIMMGSLYMFTDTYTISNATNNFESMDWDTVADGLDKFASFLNRILDNPYTDTVKNLIEAGKEMGMYIIQGIDEVLLGGDENSDFHIRITPVFDFDYAKEQFRTQFGLEPSMPISWKVIASTAYGANSQTEQSIIDYSGQLNAIQTTLQSVHDDSVTPTDVRQAFAGMKMVLNTGELVGALTDYIDEAIGRKIWMLSRGNTQ